MLPLMNVYIQFHLIKGRALKISFRYNISMCSSHIIENRNESEGWFSDVSTKLCICVVKLQKVNGVFFRVGFIKDHKVLSMERRLLNCYKQNMFCIWKLNDIQTIIKSKYIMHIFSFKIYRISNFNKCRLKIEDYIRWNKRVWNLSLASTGLWFLYYSH